MYLQYTLTPFMYNFCLIFGRRSTPSVSPSLLMFYINRPKARRSSHLLLYRSLAMDLSLWRRDRNRMDAYQMSIVDVPESPIAMAQEVREISSGVTPCIVMKNDRGSVPTRDVVFSWALNEAGAARTCGSKAAFTHYFGGTAWYNITQSMSYATMNVTFTAYCVGRTFFGRKGPGCFHSLDWRFKFGCMSERKFRP